MSKKANVALQNSFFEGTGKFPAGNFLHSRAVALRESLKRAILSLKTNLYSLIQFLLSKDQI